MTVDGTASSDQAWKEAFATASGVSLDELRLLSAIGEGGALRPVAEGQYDLVKHLSDVLGVTRTQGAAKDLRARARTLSSVADKERLTTRDRPQRLVAQEHGHLIQQQGVAQETLEVSRALMAKLNAQIEQLRTWEAWHVRQADDLRGREALQVELRERLVDVEILLAETDPAVEASHVDSVEATLAVAQVTLQMLSALVQQDTERLGAAKASVTAAGQALGELGTGDASCPTCLRPMTEAELGAATIRHESILTNMRSEQELLDARLLRCRDAGERLRSAIMRMQALPDLPPEPEAPSAGFDNADLLADADAARSAFESADEAARDLAARLRIHASAVAADPADEALSRRLTEQYREADLATLAASTLDRLAESICSEQISPLAQVLAKRWLDLWPGRPRVGLDVLSGKLFADHEATRLDVTDLSGGERTVASVLLRLLALQAASKSPILLLDEPLEHLDPRNRRMLAGVLVAAGKSASAPRQILVTTYEESVTRRLSDAAGSPSHVVHIRPGPHV